MSIMLMFPRKGDESHDVVPFLPPKYPMGVDSSSGSDTFVLGPGFEAVGNGQVPQALSPGHAHDASPPISPSTSPFSASATPQGAIVASSAPSSHTAPPSISAGSSAVSASPLPILSSTSAAVQPSVDISSTTFLSDKGWSSLISSNLPIPTSHGTTDTPSLPSSVTSSSLPSVSTIVPAVAISSDNGHGASFWAGIALLSIAGTATLITILAWWLRMRSRMRRHPWESGWRRGRTESYKFLEDAVSSSGDSTSLWQQLVDRDVGELRRSTSDLLSLYRTASHSLHLPAPAASSSFMRGPYPTVRPLPLELRHSDTSVPGVMQDIGSLRVANLIAGDILTSGDESSRPPTALDDVGTPREPSVVPKPRYLSLNGSGLEVPWIIAPQSPLQPQPNRPPPLPPPRPLNSQLITPLSGNRWKERLERSSEKPYESPDTLSAAIETGRDIPRNNIANTLSMAISTALAPPAGPGSSYYDPNAEVMHVASTMSVTSQPWTLKDAGIVHIRGAQNRAPIAPSPHGITTGVTGRPTQIGLSLVRSVPPRESLVPPRLPHLPPLPPVPHTNKARSKSTKGQHGSRRLRRLVRCSSSSASSATSVGSDMSRSSDGASMARWARLSEKEEAARHALRQRRLQSVNSASSRSRDLNR